LKRGKAILKYWKYVLTLLPIILIAVIVTTNSITASQSFELTKTVTSGPWKLEYEATKVGNEDWQLNQFLFSEGEIRVRELGLSIEFPAPYLYKMGRSEMKGVAQKIFKDQLAMSSEYNRLPNTHRMDEEEMRQFLSKMITTVTWKEEGKGEQELQMIGENKGVLKRK